MAPKSNIKKRKSQPMVELFLVTMGRSSKPSAFRTVGIYSSWELAIESARIAFQKLSKEDFFKSEEFIQEDFNEKLATEEHDGPDYNEPIVLYDNNMYFRYSNNVKKKQGGDTDVMVCMEKLQLDESSAALG